MFHFKQDEDESDTRKNESLQQLRDSTILETTHLQNRDFSEVPMAPTSAASRLGPHLPP